MGMFILFRGNLFLRDAPVNKQLRKGMTFSSPHESRHKSEFLPWKPFFLLLYSHHFWPGASPPCWCSFSPLSCACFILFNVCARDCLHGPLFFRSGQSHAPRTVRGCGDALFGGPHQPSPGLWGLQHGLETAKQFSDGSDKR